MSIYFVAKKGWRYDFTLQGRRQTEAWFKTKAEAKKAEAQKRKEMEQLPPAPAIEVQTQIGMAFLELVNRRLDHVKAHNSERHYNDYLYMAKRWVALWGNVLVTQITSDMLERFVLKRAKVSRATGNKEIRYLRATFNYGVRKKWLKENPTTGMEFFPVEKGVRYVPSADDIDRVIAVADPDTQDYLWVIRETLARVGEINQLTWKDVDLKDRHVVLYTRKKKGGSLTPRKVPMTEKLYEVLSRRFDVRDQTKPWVFWHNYWSSRTSAMCEGPYQDRKLIMKSLCKKAGVDYFRFHPLRHSGASVMDGENVPIGVIQRILGHENRSTTEIYLHAIGGSERDAMVAFEQARKKVTHKVTHKANDESTAVS
ncbi:MAG: tyrosine-type recombinase/integrase [Magnetococcales bacterium]|nr:tyrosine-type recombinase/integrase [Magnetococcales bacterium]